MEFAWEMNPARRDVPGIHVEPPALADDLDERFPGAEACQFMGASQHRKHRIFLKTLPFRRRGLRISPAMGCDALRGEEEHHWAVPRPAWSRASAGRGEQGGGVLTGTFSRDKPSLYFLFIDCKLLSEWNAP